MSLLFYFCDHFAAPEITADVTAVFVNNQHGTVMSDKDKILTRSLYLKGYTAKRLTGEF